MFSEIHTRRIALCKYELILYPFLGNLELDISYCPQAVETGWCKSGKGD